MTGDVPGVGAVADTDGALSGVARPVTLYVAGSIGHDLDAAM
jgi:hypothetical protein